VREREHARFAEPRSRDLQPDRHPRARETARHADRRNAVNVERQGVADKASVTGFGQALERCRDGDRHAHGGRQDEQIDVRK
jgi:hypothetical protein